MQLNAIFPTRDIGNDPAKIRDWAQAVEELGYSHIEVPDHVFGAAARDGWTPTYNENDPFHETFVTLGFLAAVTTKIRLSSGILTAPQRQTGLIAKQAAEVDLLSGGRLRLGIGVGWNHVEYAALGQRFEERGARLSEQIGYLRQLWQEPLLSFTGRFDRIERASILPRPARAIPIWCGGFTEPAFRRAAAMADGFIFAGPLEGALAGWRRLQDLLREAGREPAAFGAEYMLQDASGGGLSVAGGLDALQRWRDAGGSHAAVVTMGRGYRDPDEHLAHLDGCRAGLGLSP